MAKFKVENKRYVTDLVGQQICPGNVIAISRANSQDLQIYIVSTVREKSISLAGTKSRWNRKEKKWESKFSYGYKNVHLTSEELQGHIVVISNPLYSISNPQIGKAIEAADKMKDYGYFSSDYKLGQSLIEDTEK